MQVVWNGWEVPISGGGKIFKTHPDGIPAQFSAFRHVRHKHATRGTYSALTTRIVIYRSQ